MKRQKRITRTLTVAINSNSNHERIIASLDKKQFTVLMYMLRGMNQNFSISIMLKLFRAVP